MHATAVVNVATLAKTFPVGATHISVLNDVTLDVLAGQFVALIGPSGCGKSTLLRLLAGLESPTGGSLSVFSRSPKDAANAGNTGFVFQRPTLLPWRTVEENIALGMEIRKVDKITRIRRASELIAQTGLTGFENYLPPQLSGGMQSRVGIACMLALRPRLLLLDEPFASLDELTRLQMNYELQNICSRENITVIMVTHSINEAVFLSDRVVVLSARPSRILDDIPIDTPRPRRESHYFSPESAVYAEKIRGLLAASTDEKYVAS